MDAKALTTYLHSMLPAKFHTLTFLNMSVWQWVYVTVLFFTSLIASFVITKVLFWFIDTIVRRNYPLVNKNILNRAEKPFICGMTLLLFTEGVDYSASGLNRIKSIHIFETLLFILITAWILFRIADTVFAWMTAKATANNKQAALTAIPLGTKLTKAVIFIGAILTCLENTGINVSALLAGLGVGGIAVALAAKSTIENLFAGATIILDQPVRVGEYCKVGPYQGTIEHIGLRSSRIRSLNRTLITVPNSILAQEHIENYGVRDKFYFNTIIGLRYETNPDQMRFILVGIRKILYSHPKVYRDPASARLDSFADHCINIQIKAYLEADSTYTFQAIREDLMLQIMTIIDESGSGFAYPSQTLYLAKDKGLHREKSEYATQTVQKWREKLELSLPEFSEEQIKNVEGSTSYPPEGSVLHSKKTV